VATFAQFEVFRLLAEYANPRDSRRGQRSNHTLTDVNEPPNQLIVIGP
jgi:hypothetical protein